MNEYLTIRVLNKSEYLVDGFTYTAIIGITDEILRLLLNPVKT